MRWLTSATVTTTLLSCLLYAAGVDAAGGPTNRTSSTKVEIRIDNFSFKEQTLTVRPGTEVTWVNHDDAPHKIVSTDKSTFASPVLDTDGRFSFTFTKAGTYDYFCSIHPMMTGKIIVK